MLVYGIAVIIYALDQWLKWVVRSTLSPGQAIPVWPRVLEIDYIQNPGAAWGIFGHDRWLLVVIALLVVAIVVYIRTRYRLGALTQIGLGLLLGGAIGNLTDRVIFSRVTDYIYVQIINYPVFNLADSAIVVGVILILLRTLLNPSGQDVSRDDAGNLPGSGKQSEDERS